MGKKQRDCAGCGAPVGIIGRDYCCLCHRKITEAEHLIARIDAPSQLNALKTPRAAFFQTAPKAQRDARNILLLIANSYYDALTQNNGELAPFADDCGRRENGMHTAGAGRPADAPPPPGGFGGTPTDCAGQLTSRAMSYINSIDLRRVWIADEILEVETAALFHAFHRHAGGNPAQQWNLQESRGLQPASAHILRVLRSFVLAFCRSPHKSLPVVCR